VLEQDAYYHHTTLVFYKKWKTMKKYTCSPASSSGTFSTMTDSCNEGFGTIVP
jgi:hypothetical protein